MNGTSRRGRDAGQCVEGARSSLHAWSGRVKASAVALVIEGKKSLSKVSEDPDLTPSSLGKWVEQARADQGISTIRCHSSRAPEYLIALARFSSQCRNSAAGVVRPRSRAD